MPEPICEKCNDVLDHQDPEYCESCFHAYEVGIYELIAQRNDLKARVAELESRDAGWDYDLIKAERDRYREALERIILGPYAGDFYDTVEVASEALRPKVNTITMTHKDGSTSTITFSPDNGDRHIGIDTQPGA